MKNHLSELSQETTTAGDQAFAEAWLTRHYQSFLTGYVKTLAAVDAVMGIAVFLIAENNRYILTGGHLATLLLLALWPWSTRRGEVLHRFYVLLLELTFTLPWVYNLSTAFDSHAPMHLPLAASAFVAIAATMIHLAPSPKWVPRVALVLFVVGAAAWWGHAGLGRWLFVTAFLFGVTVFYEGARVQRLTAEAVSERRTRDLIEQNTRLRYEHELFLAKELQDTFTPATLGTPGDLVETQAFRRQDGPPGGVWVAQRALPTGEMILAVGDAEGEGVQAALVVHAVQTLWANALRLATFDPRLWLSQVNETLLLLGGRKAHSVTVGLAVVSRSFVEYWSAGHTPLIMMSEEFGSPHVRFLRAKGSPLGRSPDLGLGMVREALPISGESLLLLGSTAIFPPGSMQTASQLQHLLATLDAKGAAALTELPGDADADRALLRARVRPLAGRGVPEDDLSFVLPLRRAG